MTRLRRWWRAAAAVCVFLLRCLAVLAGAAWRRAFGAPLRSLRDDVALVTGGGAGLGRLIALELARQRATLVLWDVDERALERTADEVRRAYEEARALDEEPVAGEQDARPEPTCRTYLCDVTDAARVYACAERVRRDIGRDVTLLVNNAGVASGRGDFLSTPDHLVRRVFEVNALAMCWTVKAVLPAMLANDRGHVVTVASMAGYVGISRLVDYCASKHAAVGFDEALRVELEARDGGACHVRTTCISPYFIRATGMFERVRSLVPQLEAVSVAREAVLAVRRGDKELLMPWYLPPVLTLRHLVPWDCVSLFLRHLVPDAAPPRDDGDEEENEVPTPPPTKLRSVAPAATALRQRHADSADQRQP